MLADLGGDADRSADPEAQLGDDAANDRLAAIVTSSFDAIYSKDLTGRITSWNPAATRLYGYEEEEVVGQPITILIPQDRRGEEKELLARVSRGERIEHYETERVTKDGRRVDVSLSVSPIRDRNGVILGASVIGHDISETKRFRDQIAEQAEMLDLVEDAVIARDLEGRITYWNRTAAGIYGWTKDEALGNIIHELLQTAFPTSLDDIMTELLDQGRWEGDIVHTRKDRSILIAASRWALRRDDTGQPLEVLEVNNDVTTLRQAQDEQARQRQLLEVIFETSPDIIATITSRLELTYVNQAAQDMLGYSFDRLFGEQAMEWVHPDDLQPAVDMLQVAFRDGETGHLRFRVKNAALDWIWLDIHMRRMDRSDSAVVMARDITDEVQLEDDLKSSKVAAEEANQAKSDFLSRMSHELRTPLNAILGFAQLLEMDELTADQRESVEQIMKGGRRLLELINEVLDIARIESGRLALSLEPVLVGDLIDECVGLIRPLAASRAIRVESTFDDDHQHVWGDRHRLGQVMLNLLSNAVKYNVAEGTVTVTCMSPENGLLRVGVTDTGPGIPAEKVPLLFTPFERLGAEQTAIEGTGLGLALSKNLVEAMGGRLVVDTMDGEGTTFWIELRAADEVQVDPNEDVHDPDERGSDDVTAVTKTRRVLYVEDNLANLRLIERLLAGRSDVEVMSAMSGELGLDLACQHLPDLVLLDLGLPDLRGDEVLARLRRQPETADIPVIILSADATPGEIKRLMAAGAADYVTKPIDITVFMRVLEQHLLRQEERQ